MMTFVKYQPAELKAGIDYDQVYSNEHNGMTTACFLIKGEKPYHQLVASCTFQDGTEVVLKREDRFDLLAELPLDISMCCRRFHAELSVDIYHGFADRHTTFGHTKEVMAEIRKVVEPVINEDSSIHNSYGYGDTLPWNKGEAELTWTVNSSKTVVSKDFTQVVEFYTDNKETGIRRAIMIKLPATPEPYVHVGKLFTANQSVILETLGLSDLK